MFNVDKVGALSKIAGHVSRFVYYKIRLIVFLINEL